MNALLVVAHGSRKKESNDEILKRAAELNDTNDSPFDTVLCAFNQFSGPTVDEQISKLAALHVNEITVLPYFIAAGSHVTKDIPELVEQAREKYPAIRFHISPHIGAFKGINHLIIDEFSNKRNG